MDFGIKFLRLADNQWVWEGNKFQCKFNDFPNKVVFMAALQGPPHFLNSFSPQYFMVYLKQDITWSITSSVPSRLRKGIHHSLTLTHVCFYVSSYLICSQPKGMKEQTIASTGIIHFFCLFWLVYKKWFKFCRYVVDDSFLTFIIRFLQDSRDIN